MRYYVLIFLGLLLNCRAQTFSSHTVVLTPSQRPETDFEEKEYRERLRQKYQGRFKNTARLDEFIESMVTRSRGLAYSNYAYSNWPEATSYLQKLLEMTVPEAVRDNKIRLHLVREASLNANMSDDGTMLLHVGTLAELNSEAELIAVLGHEYGHYAGEHSYHRYNEITTVRNQNKYLAGGGLIGAGLMLANYKRLFSDIQSQEKEADNYGVQVFKRLTLAPEAMSNVYRRFEALGKKYKSVLGYRKPRIYFNTHPDPLKRLNNCATQFTTEEHEKGKLFVLDSAKFTELRKRAIDECIYIHFEDKNYADCLELAYREHLFAPDDEFYLFFITECLRRETVFNETFATSLFVTGQYKLEAPAAVYSGPGYIMSSLPDKEKKALHSIFFQLQSPIYDLTYDQVRAIKADQLLAIDTLEFLTNREALSYFIGKLRPTCGAHQFVLRSSGKKVNAETPVSFITDLERRYATLYPDLDQIETPHDKLFVYLGNVGVTYKKETWDGRAEDDEANIRAEYIDYFTNVAAFNELMVFQPKVNFDDRYIIYGSLSKIRDLPFKAGVYSLPASTKYSHVDPELYFIAHKYRGNRFGLVELRVTKGGRKEWEYDMYIVDFPTNRVLKRTISTKVGIQKDEKVWFNTILTDFKTWVAAQPKTS